MRINIIILITFIVTANISTAAVPDLPSLNKKIIVSTLSNLPKIIGFVGNVPTRTTIAKPTILGKRQQTVLSFFFCLLIFLGYLRIQEKHLLQSSAKPSLFFTPKNR